MSGATCWESVPSNLFNGKQLPRMLNAAHADELVRVQTSMPRKPYLPLIPLSSCTPLHYSAGRDNPSTSSATASLKTQPCAAGLLRLAHSQDFAPPGQTHRRSFWRACRFQHWHGHFRGHSTPASPCSKSSFRMDRPIARWRGPALRQQRTTELERRLQWPRWLVIANLQSCFK